MRRLFVHCLSYIIARLIVKLHTSAHVSMQSIREDIEPRCNNKRCVKARNTVYYYINATISWNYIVAKVAGLFLVKMYRVSQWCIFSLRGAE